MHAATTAYARSAVAHQRTPPFELRDLVAMPIIYSLMVPLALLDIWVTLYQRVCFWLYGLERVPRAPYFGADRRRLPYLNAIQKANCAYCGYATGLIAYVREVTARTEQYWCPIKHSRRLRAPHPRYHLFLNYGDRAAYRRDLQGLRRRLRVHPRER
jgi:hypothetical protein